MTSKSPSTLLCIVAAVFYLLVSISITFFNKALLTGYNFHYPALLLVLQHSLTIVTLECGKFFHVINYPKFDVVKCKEFLPIALLYSLNVGVALSALSALNIPMYGVLKRLSTLFVLVGESLFLHKQSSQRLKQSVLLIVMGAFIAGASDITFDLVAYFLALSSTLLQAAYLLYVAKSGAEKGTNTFGLLFYNSLLALPFVLFVFLASSELSDVKNFDTFWNVEFQICLVVNLILGSMLNFSMFLCTTVNSALTTTIIGNLKNVLAVFLGLLFLNPPPTNFVNFMGLTINAGGGIWYSIIKFKEQHMIARESLPK